MNNRRTIQPTVTDNDRFGMTFFLATIFHGIVILGITFSISPPADSKTTPTLDIILVQAQPPEKIDAPDNADFLSQVSQLGGGEAEEKSRPRELLSAESPSNELGLTPHTSSQEIHKQKQNEQQTLLTQKNATYVINTQEVAENPEDTTILNNTNTSDNSQFSQQAAEISDIVEKQANSSTKTKYLNSSTKEFVPAEYMRNWINRVERIGNLNYPDQARRNKLSGTLILDVVINENGELIKTDLRQSSGHQVLDDAAKRIVKLAAPYTAFPTKLRKEANVIHITRSWEFFNNSSIRTR